MFAVFDPRDTSFFIYCKSSIKRLRGWACSHAQTCRHLIGPPCMRQKATRSKASGAIVEYMVALTNRCAVWESMASPCGAIDFYSSGGGSHAAIAVYLKSSIKRLRGWACSHAQTYFLFCCRRRVSARDRLRDPYAVHGGGHDSARITGSFAAGVEAGSSGGLQCISAGNPDR